MKLVERYLLAEIIPPSLLSLFVFSFILLMNTILHLADLLIRRGVSLKHILQMMLYLTPSILVFTIPVALLLGVMVGLSRLASDSEITAMMAGGVSPYRLLKPIIIFSVLFFLIDIWFMNSALPWGNQSFRELNFKILSGRVISGEIKPRVFNEDFPGKVLYISEIDDKTGLWKRIFVFDLARAGEPRVILAKEGISVFEKEKKRLILSLPEARVYQSSNIDPKRRSSFARFEDMDLVLLTTPSFDEMNLGKDERSMRADELKEEARRNKGKSRLTGILINRTDKPAVAKIKVEFQPGTSTVNNSHLFPIPLSPKETRWISLPLTAPSLLPDDLIAISAIYSGKTTFYQEFTLNKATHSPALLRHLRLDDNLTIASLGFEEIHPRGDYLRLEVEYHKRYAIPFACLVFGILGFSFALRFKRGGKAGSYVIGLIVFVIYWAFFINGEALGDNGKIPPFLGMWGANIFFGAIGFSLLTRIKFAEKTKFRFLSSIGVQLAYIFAKLKNVIKKRTKKKKEGRPILLKKLPLPSILDRYISRNFIVIFVLVMISVYSIFALIDFIEMNEEIERNNLSHLLLVEFFKFKLPQILVYIIPISILMATMVTIGIMAKNKETIAAKAGGISIYRLFIPFLFFAVIGSGAVFIIQDRILPYSNQRLSEIIQVIKGAPPQTYRQEMGSRFLLGRGNRLFHHEGYDEERGIIHRFSVYEFDPTTFSLNKIIFALSLRWDTISKSWTYYNDGWICRFPGGKVTVERFRKLQRYLPPEEPSYFSRIILEPEEMSFKELKTYIKELKLLGAEATREEVELHWKIAFPFLALIITLIGLAFSLRAEGGGIVSSIFFSIAIVVIYWVFWSIFKNLGYLGVLPPSLGAWSPNIIFGVGAVYLILSLRT